MNQKIKYGYVYKVGNRYHAFFCPPLGKSIRVSSNAKTPGEAEYAIAAAKAEFLERHLLEQLGSRKKAISLLRSLDVFCEKSIGESFKIAA